MNLKGYTSALIALGVVSAASAAPIRIQITGSTAFRANFFSAASTAGGIFAAAPAVLVPSGTPSSGSSVIVYDGFVGAQEYILACSWTGSEAGIANVAGNFNLQNPGNPGFAIPGATTKFPNNDGSAGTVATQGDLALSDTSQSSSLSQPPTWPALTSFGVVGAVTFTWMKGFNSAPDSSWTHLNNVASSQLVTALGSTVGANFITGNSADTDPVGIVGRNAGSGTRANFLLDCFFPLNSAVSQVAVNSAYNASGVLVYAITPVASPFGAPQVAAAVAASYPTVAASGVTGFGDDGFESGSGVANVMQCDQTGSGVVLLGYAGIPDSLNAKNGVAYVPGSATPPQPGGAVWLSLDGVPYSDAAVVNGAYSLFGHEHLYGKVGVAANIAAFVPTIKAGINAKGNLGNGTAGPSGGILSSVMAADKANGGDTGYPAPITIGTFPN
jgi:hypothetical protein